MGRIATKPKEFKIYAPSAKRVSIAGNFNNWDSKDIFAKKDSKGNWSVKLNLKPGRYEYKFVIDGNWVNDPNCNSCVPNSLGSHNCIAEIK